MKKKILIADRRPAYRQTLCATFTRPPEEEQIYEAAKEQELFDLLARYTFDLVIVNQSLFTDITILPRVKCIILASQLDMVMIVAARMHGTHAYLQEEALVSLICQIAELPQGSFFTDPAFSAQLADYLAHHQLFSVNDEELTFREREVFHLLLNRVSKQHIAERLHISVNTVKAHVRSIYNKLKVNRYLMEIFSILHDPDTKDQ